MSDTDEIKSPFLLTPEAASYLRVTPRTMENWRWSNCGPKYRKHGGTVVYRVDDLEDYSKVWNSKRGTGNGA